MNGNRDVHVFQEVGRRYWRVTQEGRLLSRHRTQDTAIQAGRRAAKRERTELVTHGRNGEIRAKDSFGRESAAPDGER